MDSDLSDRAPLPTDPTRLHIPSEYVSIVDPVDGNPFPPGTIPHRFWGEVTQVAEENICRLKADRIAALVASRRKADWIESNSSTLDLATLLSEMEQFTADDLEQTRELIAENFAVWAARGAWAAFTDTYVRANDDWLVRYADATLDWWAGVMRKGLPDYTVDRELHWMRDRLAAQVLHWKAEARRHLREREARSRPLTLDEISRDVQRQRDELRRERLEPLKKLDPAQWLILRVVRTLPWRTVDYPEEEAATWDSEQLLKIDHAELRRRLTDPRLRFSGGWPIAWNEFSGAVQEAVLEAYATGEVDYLHSQAAIRRCYRAFGVEELGITEFLRRSEAPGGRTEPQTWKGHRPQIPSWIKRVAMTLVEILETENPRQPVALNEHNNWTTPIFAAAVDWLVTLGVCDAATPVKQRTLDTWSRDPQWRPTRTPRRPGRPRRPAATVSPSEPKRVD